MTTKAQPEPAEIAGESARSAGADPFTITLLDVGEEQYGDAVLCRFGRVSVLVDGAHPGNHRRKGGHLAIQEQLRPLLPQRGGASVVTLLIVSHAHQDHIGCLPRLVGDGHLVADWALVADPELGWGKTGRERAAPEVSPTALRIAEALREEPHEAVDLAEEAAFLEAARRLDDQYREMLDALAAKGTRVIRFTGSDDPALQPLVEELARSGVVMRLPGPTRRQVTACADGISGNLEALSLEIDRVLKAEAALRPADEAGSEEAVALGVYRTYASILAAEPAGTGPEEAGGIPRVSNFVNLQSSVIAFEHRGKKILLTGDMQLAEPQTSDPTVLAGMRDLLQAIREGGPYDFVKMSHHGSDNGISDELMELMGRPRLLGLCAGENSRRHPNEATLDLLKRTIAQRELRWARTDKNGLTTITFDRGSPTVAVSCGQINDASPPKGQPLAEGAAEEEAARRRRAREVPVASGPCIAAAGGGESISGPGESPGAAPAGGAQAPALVSAGQGARLKDGGARAGSAQPDAAARSTPVTTEPRGELIHMTTPATSRASEEERAIRSGPIGGACPSDGGYAGRASEAEPVGMAMALPAEAGPAEVQGVMEDVPGYQRRKPGAVTGPQLGLEAAAAAAPRVDRVLGAGALGAMEAAAAPQELYDAAFLTPVTQLESVLGADDRRLITPTTEAPWRAICALRITTRMGVQLVGTGWLINPRVVVTAGHCVYSHGLGGWMDSVEVIPALDFEARPLGSVVGTRLRSVDGWIRDRSPEYDFGAILLDQPVQLGSEFFTPLPLSDAELSGILANIAGYPSDREMASRLFYHARAVQSVGTRRLQYDVDTFGGQSGSPVWVTRPDGTRVVVAIHTNGISPGVKFNSGTRITADVLQQLREWSAQVGMAPIRPGSTAGGATPQVPEGATTVTPPSGTTVTPPATGAPVIYVCYPVAVPPSAASTTPGATGGATAPASGMGEPGVILVSMGGPCLPAQPPGAGPTANTSLPTEAAAAPIGTGAAGAPPAPATGNRSWPGPTAGEYGPPMGSMGAPPATGAPPVTEMPPVMSAPPATGSLPAAASRITGKVVDRQGRPLAGATVAISRGDAPYPEIAAISAADGSFAVPITAAGTYVLTAYSREHSGTATVTVGPNVPATATIPILGSRQP